MNLVNEITNPLPPEYYVIRDEIRQDVLTRWNIFETLQNFEGDRTYTEQVIARYQTFSRFILAAEQYTLSLTDLIDFYIWALMLNDRVLISKSTEMLRKSDQIIENTDNLARMMRELEKNLSKRIDEKTQSVIKELTHYIDKRVTSAEDKIKEEIQTNSRSIIARIDEQIDLVQESIQNSADAIIRAVSDVYQGLSRQLRNVERTLKDWLLRSTRVLLQRISQIETHVDEHLTSISESWERRLQDWVLNINAHFDRKTLEITNSFRSLIADLSLHIDEKFSSFSQSLTVNIGNIKNDIVVEINNVKDILVRLIDARFNALITLTGEIKTTVTGTLEIVTGIAFDVTGMLALVGTLQIELEGMVAGLVAEFAILEVSFSKTNDLVESIPQKTSEEITSQIVGALAPIPEKTTELVCSNIVGTTYYRWDLDTNYYPTLVFLFEEEKEGLPRKQTQIKCRLPFTTETLPPNIMEILRTRIGHDPDISYFRGPIRASFVHPQKRWKTTIFVREQEEAKTLMRYVSKISGIEPALEGLSFTEGRNKLTQTKLRINLKDINKRSDDPLEVFQVKIKRIVLLINNSQSPNVVWSRI